MATTKTETKPMILPETLQDTVSEALFYQIANGRYEGAYKKLREEVVLSLGPNPEVGQTFEHASGTLRFSEPRKSVDVEMLMNKIMGTPNFDLKMFLNGCVSMFNTSNLEEFGFGDAVYIPEGKEPIFTIKASAEYKTEVVGILDAAENTVEPVKRSKAAPRTKKTK